MAVRSALSDIYHSGSYRFLYSSLVMSHFPARDRLRDDLNCAVYPTCYLDGGHVVVMGNENPIPRITAALDSAGTRRVVDVDLSVSLEWLGDQWIKVVVELTPFLCRCGDLDGDGIVDISDAIFLINLLFLPISPAPMPLQSADIDCNGTVEIVDAVYLISYIFVPNSTAPCDPDGDLDPDC